ncbi:MAG: glycosyltransferase family 9 protein [Kiritimatiellae bacterium]|nr:glycosyltransferase family 9 protein [Kiritimatiellia bacterium]MDD5523032.1 glycosyltransferase family 9 protein [Kiritimatiellia bacterium]
MRILVIKLSSLGDLFHALPAVHSLKVGLGAEVDWVVHREYVDLVRCFNDVSRVIPFYRDSFFTNIQKFLKELRGNRYDYIIDFQGLLKSALVVGLARGKTRIGPSFHREGTGLFYSVIAGKRDKTRHAVEECMDVVRLLGVKELKEFPVRFPEKKLTEKRPRVAILPVSRWSSKNWPTKCFIEVIRRLQCINDASFFLMGGPDDIDVCEEIVKAVKVRITNMAGKCSIVETGGLLKEMDLLVANDSGPVHMAVAVGTPALVIFGPTDPARTGPYGPPHRVVRTLLDCQPCFSRTCRREGIPCLSGVTPEKVGEVAFEMLKSRR